MAVLGYGSIAFYYFARTGTIITKTVYFLVGEIWIYEEMGESR